MHYNHEHKCRTLKAICSMFWFFRTLRFQVFKLYLCQILSHHWKAYLFSFQIMCKSQFKKTNWPMWLVLWSRVTFVVITGKNRTNFTTLLTRSRLIRFLDQFRVLLMHQIISSASDLFVVFILLLSGQVSFWCHLWFYWEYFALSCIMYNRYIWKWKQLWAGKGVIDNQIAG